MILRTTFHEIELRQYQLKEADALANMANNRNIWLNLRNVFPHPYTVEDGERYISMCLAQQPNTVFGIWYQNQLVGSIGLHLQHDVYSHSAELGYFIGEPYWNKSIATIAVARMLQYGWEDLQLYRIFASVFEHNIASMKVLLNNGFQPEGVKGKAIFKDNQFIDEYCYGIIKS